MRYDSTLYMPRAQLLTEDRLYPIGPYSASGTARIEESSDVGQKDRGEEEAGGGLGPEA